MEENFKQSAKQELFSKTMVEIRADSTAYNNLLHMHFFCFLKAATSKT